MTKPTTAPGSVQDALNYQFFLDRLDDPGLLDRAVVTEDNDLAVPVGGKRRGGYVGATSRAASRRLVQQLAARPDEFPVARLYYHSGAGWRQNNLDQVAHGTHNKASRDECTQSHEYTPQNTILVYGPDGSVRQRRCRKCEEAKGARYRALEAQPPASDEERCTDPEGCDRRKVAKDLCRKHYARQWRAEREAAEAS